MSKSDQPGKKKPSKSEKDPETLITTPISIARARHASTYGKSVVDDPEAITSILTKSSSRPATASPPRPAAQAADRNFLPMLNTPNGCLAIFFLGAAFIVGGILGGLVGGGMLMWANNSGRIAFLADPATATPSPTATPMPVSTSTPTSTPLPPVATTTVEDIIETVMPSVVTVINQQGSEISPRRLFDEGRVVGSGVIIDERGYIATNNHVVDAPGQLRIILADGRESTADLIATNPAEDLAIIKIDLSDLKPIVWGDSYKIRPGQMVFAIGSPLGDFPNSVSLGIVSGLNRALEIDKYVIDGLIQTDAAINRGSSGGPLINMQGQVIGINTFIIRESEERGIAEGIAFSIPADTAKNLLIPWIAAHTGESVPIPASKEND